MQAPDLSNSDIQISSNSEGYQASLGKENDNYLFPPAQTPTARLRFHQTLKIQLPEDSQIRDHGFRNAWRPAEGGQGYRAEQIRNMYSNRYKVDMSKDMDRMAASLVTEQHECDEALHTPNYCASCWLPSIGDPVCRSAV